MLVAKTAPISLTLLLLVLGACAGVDPQPGAGGAGGVPGAVDAGKCDYSDPTKVYKSKDPAQCRVMLYSCPTGSVPFTDSCGCGCQTKPARCEIIECFRAVLCVEKCGGPVLSSGCCPCPPPTFDSISCTSGTP
jgi:hypothetical protein